MNLPNINQLMNLIKAVPLKAVTVVFASSATMLFLSTSSSELDTANTQACVCDSNITYQASLPSSHPNNRCADQANNLSWGNWITGNSRSSQFHFIDLLELLHGNKDKPIQDIPTPNTPKRI